VDIVDMMDDHGYD